MEGAKKNKNLHATPKKNVTQENKSKVESSNYETQNKIQMKHINEINKTKWDPS
jgi:hypothetical protein